MNNRNVLLGAFLLYSAVHAWTELKNCNDLPWPPHYIAAGMLMVMLYLAGIFVSEEMSSLMAVGLVLAGLIKGWKGDCSHSADCQGTPMTTSIATVQGGGTPT